MISLEGDVVFNGWRVSAVSAFFYYRRRSVVVCAVAARSARVGGSGRSAVSTAQEDHVLGDHLGGVVLLVLFVRPLARLESALDVALTPLGQVLPADLPQFSPDHDPVPLGS